MIWHSEWLERSLIQLDIGTLVTGSAHMQQLGLLLALPTCSYVNIAMLEVH